MKRINTVLYLTESLKESLEIYEMAAEKQGRKRPVCGYIYFEAGDSKESIQRRISVIREELLKLSKSL